MQAGIFIQWEHFNGTGAVAIIGDGTAEYLTHLSMIESVLDNVSSGKKHEPAK